MKGPMKGATIGHAKQRIKNGQYLGITEPGIIAAESPNPIVNDLVILRILRNAWKLLSARTRYCGISRGAGTAEEILYLLGILLHPDNKDMPFPLIFTGPDSSEDYFKEIDQFIAGTLGKDAQQHYQIIIDDPELVARECFLESNRCGAFRKEKGDAYYFNWQLKLIGYFSSPLYPRMKI